MAVKSFIVQAPGADNIMIFWSKFTHSICKLDHFSAKEKILYNNEMV